MLKSNFERCNFTLWNARQFLESNQEHIITTPYYKLNGNEHFRLQGCLHIIPDNRVLIGLLVRDKDGKDKLESKVDLNWNLVLEKGTVSETPKKISCITQMKESDLKKSNISLTIEELLKPDVMVNDALPLTWLVDVLPQTGKVAKMAHGQPEEKTRLKKDNKTSTNIERRKPYYTRSHD